MADPTALAPAFQAWSEMYERMAHQAPARAIAWYLNGMAVAYGVCAETARELLSPTTTDKPTKQILAMMKPPHQQYIKTMIAFSDMLASKQEAGATKEEDEDGLRSLPQSPR